MVIPSTALGIAALLVLVIPGTVYAAVRTAVGGRGPHDSEVGTRILRAIIASVIFNASYLLVLGSWLIDLFATDGVTQRPRAAGFTALALGIGVPALTAFVIHGRPELQRTSPNLLAWLPKLNQTGLPWPRATTGHESTPTAWDWAMEHRGASWVRVRLPDGTWIAGWFGERSFVSTYPEPRDLYVESQHHVNDQGRIGDAVEDSGGFWLALSDGCVVEWINPEQSPSEEKDDAG